MAIKANRDGTVTFEEWCSASGCGNRIGDTVTMRGPGGRNAAVYAAMRLRGWKITFFHVKGVGRVMVKVCPRCQEMRPNSELEPFVVVRMEWRGK